MMTGHAIVSRAEWTEARKALLAEEKAFTRQREALAAKRRALPWVRIDEDYDFDGADGKRTLAELFDGRSQLVVYHFMFGPDWQAGCPSCSFLADDFDGAVVHLAQRDVTMVAASRAPYEKLDAYRRRMGWRFEWVSSHGSDFNRDFHVSFSDAELAAGPVYYNYAVQPFPATEAPGLSVFFRDADGTIYHTYSCYARGLDTLIGTYQYLDLVPKGRDEQHLPFTMAWVRRHDEYDRTS
jgi:predicted dithiol-disulfide oxidoreductase (DUF899 family)